MSALVVVLALGVALDKTLDLDVAKTLLVEYQANADKANTYIATYKESRWSSGRAMLKTGRVESTQYEAQKQVEETKAGENFLVKQELVANATRGGKAETDTYVIQLVKNDQYVAYFTPPYLAVELWYVSETSEGLRGPRQPIGQFQAATSRSPSRYGFGDGDLLLPQIVERASFASSFSCKAMGDEGALFEIEIVGTNLVETLLVDAERGALILRATVFVDGEKRREIEVIPEEYDGVWFPKTWREINYSPGEKVRNKSVNELVLVDFQTPSTKFSVQEILPTHDTAVMVRSGATEAEEMYSVDGVLVDREMRDRIRRDLDSGGSDRVLD
jgi:hypothetical protein